MIHSKAQIQLADAMANMMRACALATTRAASTSVFQGMSFWAGVVSASANRQGQARDAMLPPPEDDPSHADASSEAAFSSYRSSGGHAVAQIIVPTD